MTARSSSSSARTNLAAKAQNPTADVRVWATEIDQLVYGLYGLTEEEIGIVEGAQ